MKIKNALVFIGIGYCIDVFGALQKIMHTYYADTVLVTAGLFKITGVIVLLYKLLTHPKAKEFLNW